MSASSKAKDTIFICNNLYKENNSYEYYSYYYNNTYCFLYDIQRNNFTKKYIIEQYCYNFKLYFFNEINEYNLICYIDKLDYRDYKDLYKKDYSNEVKIFKFNENFSFSDSDIINKKYIDVSHCMDMNSFSLIYNKFGRQHYKLISDCQDKKVWYISNNSKIIEAGENYNNQNSSGTPSSPPKNKSHEQEGNHTHSHHIRRSDLIDSTQLSYIYNYPDKLQSTIFSEDETTINNYSDRDDISQNSALSSNYSDYSFGTNHHFSDKINLSNYIQYSNSINFSDYVDKSLFINHSDYLDNSLFINESLSDKIFELSELPVIKYEINQTKEDLASNFEEILSKIEIGKKYEFKGDDYIIMIRPTNSS